MKIAVIGAPGSGKTHISKIIAKSLNLHHIECDEIFWGGIELLPEVERLTNEDHWIVEGHMSKVSDIVLPKADKIIVIEGLNLRSLFRSLRSWKTGLYNLTNYAKLAEKRQELVRSLLETRKEDVLFLDNSPDLSESYLAAFSENLKSSTVKPRKKTVKRESP